MTPTPFEGLPASVQAALVLFYIMGSPKARRPREEVTDWMALQFFRTLDDEHLNLWLKKAANDGTDTP